MDHKHKPAAVADDVDNRRLVERRAQCCTAVDTRRTVVVATDIHRIQALEAAGRILQVDIRRRSLAVEDIPPVDVRFLGWGKGRLALHCP